MHTLWSNIYAKQIGCFNLFKAYMVSTPYILKAQDYNLLSLVSEITRTLLQRHFTQWVHINMLSMWNELYTVKLRVNVAMMRVIFKVEKLGCLREFIVWFRQIEFEP